MIISKMIEELEKLKEIKGDVEIYYNSEVGVTPVIVISNIQVGFSGKDSDHCLVIF
jgi:hypothetical protein